MTVVEAALVHERNGNGDLLLFIHGLGGTSNVFTPQTELLSEHFTCLRPDLPGAGRSPCVQPLTIDTLVENLAALINAEAAGRPVRLIAHSMGTVIAQHMALRFPDRISSLCLIGPMHAPVEVARAALRTRAELARSRGMVPIADAVAQGALSPSTKAHKPIVTAFVRELLMRQDPLGYAAHCEALAAAEPADLARIEHPVLLISGNEDATAPLPAVEQLASRLRRSRLCVLEDCGHWATLEQPAEVNKMLIDFLGGGASA